MFIERSTAVDSRRECTSRVYGPERMGNGRVMGNQNNGEKEMSQSTHSQHSAMFSCLFSIQNTCPNTFSDGVISDTPVKSQNVLDASHTLCCDPLRREPGETPTHGEALHEDGVHSG